VKSAAYVSTAREVSQPKFIAHFICKALLAALSCHSINNYISLINQEKAEALC